MTQTVVITGASRGIGLALARGYAARGARVVAVTRTPHAALPEGAENRVADVTDPASLATAAEGIGPVDLLICNAGLYLGRGRIGDPGFAPEDWQQVLMTNVAGPYLAAEAFLPALRIAGGRIAIISSAMASNRRAKGGSYMYRASKAAATNLASNLATDLAGEGIAVGAYHPGWVRTDMGGQQADIGVEDSANGLIARFEALSMATTGVFEDWQGNPVPF